MTLSNLLFTSSEGEQYRIKPIKLDFTVTMPIHPIRAEFTDGQSWSALEVNDILALSLPDNKIHKKFYEILETMKTLNTLEKLVYLYTRGSSHISTPLIDIRDEGKAIEILKTWVDLANKLHKTLGIKDVLVLDDHLMLKIARESNPTIFQMPEDSESRCYDDTKSEITYLSPYEDNAKNLKKHKKSINCVIGVSKILHLLKDKKGVFTV